MTSASPTILEKILICLGLTGSALAGSKLIFSYRNAEAGALKIDEMISKLARMNVAILRRCIVGSLGGGQGGNQYGNQYWVNNWINWINWARGAVGKFRKLSECVGSLICQKKNV